MRKYDKRSGYNKVDHLNTLGIVCVIDRIIYILSK